MPQLTHASGAPVVDNTNSQTAGPRGPVLMQDIWLLEKLSHSDREAIPERRMHAKGSVSGIGLSPDKMLQGRLFSCGDAHRYRLGVNSHQIPVNAPRCPFHSYHRDGAMRVDGNHGRTIGYQPNSQGEWSDQPALVEPPLALHGAAPHWDHRADDDHFEQPGALFRLMSPDEQQRPVDNTARSLGGASLQVQLRHVAHCTRADPAYGRGVAFALERLGQTLR